MSEQISRHGRHPTGRFGRFTPLVVALSVAGAVGWLAVVADTSARSMPTAAPAPRPSATDTDLRSFPVVVDIHAIPAGEARLADDQVVIGVSVGSQHRAYLLDALRPLEGHVVNDYFADTPVTVSYCDLHECVKVYSDDETDHPLDIAVGGIVGRVGDGSLLLFVGNDRYRQDTGQPFRPDRDQSFPYTVTAHRRTTWGEWRTAHPDTDVYVGPAIQ